MSSEPSLPGILADALVDVAREHVTARLWMESEPLDGLPFLEVTLSGPVFHGSDEARRFLEAKVIEPEVRHLFGAIETLTGGSLLFVNGALIGAEIRKIGISGLTAIAPLRLVRSLLRLVPKYPAGGQAYMWIDLPVRPSLDPFRWGFEEDPDRLSSLVAEAGLPSRALDSLREAARYLGSEVLGGLSARLTFSQTPHETAHARLAAITAIRRAHDEIAGSV